MNDHAVKDSFEAVDRIHAIPDKLFEEGYHYVSFDVTSLFTSVPLDKTIKIILQRIYEEKVIDTRLKKNTLKKLLKDACMKTAFSFNDVIYKQIDGVSMGSSLGPSLANVIMTELEKQLVAGLIDTGTIKFYMRYVDDTLVLAKSENFQKILEKLNSFDNNLKFTIDTFDDDDVHFLDINIDRNKTDLYYKPTHTGQYANFTSQSPWRFKTAWVKALYHRASKICSETSKFNNQISKIKLFLSWNGYPSYVTRSLLKRFKSPRPNESANSNGDRVEIFIKVPYAGIKGEHLLRSCIQKLCRYTKKNVRFVTLFQTKKSSMFCPTKDKIPANQKANVIYKIKCPGCGEIYIGKTDRCISIRLNEHGTRSDQPMHLHLSNCSPFHEYLSILNLPLHDETSPSTIDIRKHILNTVLNNYSIVDSNSSWSLLSFLEAFYIKRFSPALNKGLKASKELQLFS